MLPKQALDAIREAAKNDSDNDFSELLVGFSVTLAVMQITRMVPPQYRSGFMPEVVAAVEADIVNEMAMAMAMAAAATAPKASS